MDVIARIRELADARGWTDYRLCKESGIPSTTISNMLHRNTLPTIATLERICAAFGLTLSEFFLPPDSDLRLLTKDEIELLQHWSCLSDRRKAMMLELAKEMKL